MSGPEPGDTFTLVRQFDPEDVDTFAAVTGDDQSRHTEPDSEGRRLVQGLLTGSLLTDIGGDLDMLARSMEFHFIRPVYTGDTLRCVWENDRVAERPNGWDVTARVTVERLGGEGEEFADESGDTAVGDGGAAAGEGSDGAGGGVGDGSDGGAGRRPSGPTAPDAALPAPGEGEPVLEATVDGLIRE